MSELLTDLDIDMLLNGINDPPSIVSNNTANFICPYCRISTKRIRISNPDRVNRKEIFDHQANKNIKPMPLDLHFRILNEQNIVTNRFVLKPGFTFCFSCKKSWFQ